MRGLHSHCTIPEVLKQRPVSDRQLAQVHVLLDLLAVLVERRCKSEDTEFQVRVDLRRGDRVDPSGKYIRVDVLVWPKPGVPPASGWVEEELGCDVCGRIRVRVDLRQRSYAVRISDLSPEVRSIVPTLLRDRGRAREPACPSFDCKDSSVQASLSGGIVVCDFQTDVILELRNLERVRRNIRERVRHASLQLPRPEGRESGRERNRSGNPNNLACGVRTQPSTIGTHTGEVANFANCAIRIGVEQLGKSAAIEDAIIFGVSEYRSNVGCRFARKVITNRHGNAKDSSDRIVGGYRRGKQGLVQMTTVCVRDTSNCSESFLSHDPLESAPILSGDLLIAKLCHSGGDGDACGCAVCINCGNAQVFTGDIVMRRV